MEEEKKSCPKGQVSKSTNISKPKVSVWVGVGREKWPGSLSCVYSREPSLKGCLGHSGVSQALHYKKRKPNCQGLHYNVGKCPSC